jgi:hypothetical protein
MTDPGAKSIVFSAWADSLHSKPPYRYSLPYSVLIAFDRLVIEHALVTNGMSHFVWLLALLTVL